MDFRIVLIVVGALSVAGLIWLGFGGPRGRLARRSLAIATPLLPLVAVLTLLALAPSSHHGGLLTVTAFESFVALSPFLLGWFLVCFFVWVVGKIVREPNA